MAQEFELADYTDIHEFGKTETNCGDSKHSGVTHTDRSLFRFGILTIGVLCITQAVLNISLRLAFNSNKDTDPFPFPLNGSVIADMCQLDQPQQNSTQFCSCHNKLLRRLLREYQALETERNLLRNKVIRLTGAQPRSDDDFPESGSGSPDDLFTNDYS